MGEGHGVDASIGPGTLPAGIYDLIEQIDLFVAERPKNRRMPVLLLKRGTHGDRTANELISYYQTRLVNEEDLVPHVYVKDSAVADADEPHVRFVEVVADGLQRSKPPGSGQLRLPLFRTCQAILDVEVTGKDDGVRRRALRDALYDKDLRERWSWVDTIASVTESAGTSFFSGIWQAIAKLVLVAAPRWVYGVWLNRSRGLRKVRNVIGPQGRIFLGAALDITSKGSQRENPALVQRVLLTALLVDLTNAVTAQRFRIFRSRRKWSYVLLLGGVGDESAPSRQFVDNYDAVVRDGTGSPLLILGALDADAPTNAEVLVAQAGARGRTVLSDRVRDLYRGRSLQDNTNLYLVRLPADNDDGTSARSLKAHYMVRPRQGRRTDVARALALPVVIVVLVGWGIVRLVDFWLGSSACHIVANREIVGVTDGAACSLAWPGDKGRQLRDLESTVRDQNAAVDKHLPWRTVVFFAPLSVADGTGDVSLNGLSSLNGAILAQAAQNKRVGGNHMQIRLLIANPGDKFAFGYRNGDRPDVAQEIIDRIDRDRIAAVTGITQSRPLSIQAINELDARQVPIIASSVAGSDMVNPDTRAARYFQVSPTNARIAKVMAEFAQHSPQLAAVTGPSPGDPTGRREAIVVYHEDDKVFSNDLESKLAPELTGQVLYLVPFPEQTNGQDIQGIAENICHEVERSDGYVLYVGRSARMPDLIDAMKLKGGCIKKDGHPLAIFAESVPTTYLDKPASFATDYPHFSLYYTAFAPSTPTHPSENSIKDGDEASAYDALGVASEAIDGAYSLNKPNQLFPPNAVYAFIHDRGINDYQGVTGVLTLHDQVAFPPDKATYVLKIGEDSPYLECGLLPDKKPPPTWGVPRREFLRTRSQRC